MLLPLIWFYRLFSLQNELLNWNDLKNLKKQKQVYLGKHDSRIAEDNLTEFKTMRFVLGMIIEEQYC